MNNTNNCMVSVFCTTYNQKKYIAKCLESMVNQKTNFPYEIIVRDDASTDGTSDIVREFGAKYPDKIVPFIQPENLFQRGLEHISFEKMFRMSKGKYIAVCDGDDFWTDENKLQKQVDFMESHPDYSMCGHAAYFAREDGRLHDDKFFRLSRGSGDLSRRRSDGLERTSFAKTRSEADASRRLESISFTFPRCASSIPPAPSTVAPALFMVYMRFVHASTRSMRSICPRMRWAESAALWSMLGAGGTQTFFGLHDIFLSWIFVLG